MKKHIIIIIALALVVIGLWYGKSGLFGNRIVITAPTNNQTFSREGAYSTEDPILVKGKAIPESSVYLFDVAESCIRINTPSFGSGAVDSQGNFSVAFQQVKQGKNTTKVLNVTEEEEKEYGKDCYPEKFFSKPITFTLSASLNVE